MISGFRGRPSGRSLRGRLRPVFRVGFAMLSLTRPGMVCGWSMVRASSGRCHRLPMVCGFLFRLSGGDGMKRVVIDSLHDLAVAALRGDDAAGDAFAAALDHNGAVWAGLLEDVKAGRASVLWWDSRPAASGAFTRRAVHLSTRGGAELFQLSTMMIDAAGAVIPLSHRCGDSVRDLDLPDGVTVCAA